MTIDESGPAPGPWYKRLGWFLALWAAGVIVVGAVAYFIRWWLV